MLFDCAHIKVNRHDLRRMPDIPASDWRPPTEFPNLAMATDLSFDVETKDPDLKEMGAGWARQGGHMVGFSVGARARDGTRGKWYFPFEHTVQSEMNMDKAQCLSWLNYTLGQGRPIAGANLTYDMGYLSDENIYPTGDFYDTYMASKLIDFDAPAGLDDAASRYGVGHKVTGVLQEWCEAAYQGNYRANLHRAPVTLVGPYAEMDAVLPIDVMDHQVRELVKLGLWDVFRMECDLIPLMVQMRKRGMRVDIDKASRLHEKLEGDIALEYAKLYQLTGQHVSVNANADLARIFDAAGIRYPRTEAGNPSFVKEWLEKQEHPIALQVLRIREYLKIRGTFIQSYILENHKNGYVHGTFNQFGARTGRLSSSGGMNLQNIPARTALGLQVREIFVPDYGHVGMLSKDYASVEYRMLAHFAQGPSGDRVRQIFVDDPKTDYHQMTIDLVKEQTGMLIKRKPIKTVNFGLVFGSGEPKLASMLKMTLDAAKVLFKAYHKGAPYVRDTMDWCSDTAERDGMIRSFMGRINRFDNWEPKRYEDREDFTLRHGAASAKWGSHRIQRAGLYKALNYLLQGSAAEAMKMGMLKMWKSGALAVTGVPSATVHDECLWSQVDRSREQEEAYKEIERCMAYSLQFKVPLICDTENGPSWGEQKETKWSALQ